MPSSFSVYMLEIRITFSIVYIYYAIVILYIFAERI